VIKSLWLRSLQLGHPPASVYLFRHRIPFRPSGRRPGYPRSLLFLRREQSVCDARHFLRECAEVDRFTHPTEEVRGPPRFRSVMAWRADHRNYVRFCGLPSHRQSHRLSHGRHPLQTSTARKLYVMPATGDKCARIVTSSIRTEKRVCGGRITDFTALFPILLPRWKEGFPHDRRGHGFGI